MVVCSGLWVEWVLDRGRLLKQTRIHVRKQDSISKKKNLQNIPFLVLIFFLNSLLLAHIILKEFIIYTTV